MNRMILPSLFFTSFITAFRRSSNSPRYFAPAISAPRSKDTRRTRSVSGTSPCTIRFAKPSTMAVLPTPGSPISTGLFFVRRHRMRITRRISSSRPITGSIFPSSACFTRSMPYWFSASYAPSGASESAGALPRFSLMASSSFFIVRPTLSNSEHSVVSLNSATIKWSCATRESLFATALS